MDAKQDLRLKSSGDLLGFQFEDVRWPLISNPNFYDYLYVRGLVNHPDKNRLLEFDAFTDIAYSQNTPQRINTKSHNCQARSAAIYCSLLRRMPEVDALAYLKGQFKKVESQSEQLGLF